VLAAVAMTAVLLLSAGSASARPLVGHDGKIHACYRVKGKPRGALRVVKSRKAHCRRGERRVAWIVVTSGPAGPTGQQGQRGTPGVDGGQGADGADGSSPSLSALEAQVATLSTRVESLEGVLAGVTNAELLEAVGLPPVVDALCAQTTTLTSTLDLLNAAVGSLSLNEPLLILGGLLNIPTLPATLGAFSCP
jgi:hypothetical protein